MLEVTHHQRGIVSDPAGERSGRDGLRRASAAFNVEFDEPTPDADVIAGWRAAARERGESRCSSRGTDRTASPSSASARRSTRTLSTPTSRSSTLSPSGGVGGSGGDSSRRRWPMRGNAGPPTGIPRHERGRRRASPVRELRLHQPRGQAGRAAHAVLTNELCMRSTTNSWHSASASWLPTSPA